MKDYSKVTEAYLATNGLERVYRVDPLSNTTPRAKIMRLKPKGAPLKQGEWRG